MEVEEFLNLAIEAFYVVQTNDSTIGNMFVFEGYEGALLGVSQKLISKSREPERSALGFLGMNDSRLSSIRRFSKAFSFRLRASSESSTCEEANSSELSDPRLTGSGVVKRVLFWNEWFFDLRHKDVLVFRHCWDEGKDLVM